MKSQNKANSPPKLGGEFCTRILEMMMKRYVLSAAVTALALMSSASAGQQPASTSGTPREAQAPQRAAVSDAVAPFKATIDQYCVTCHNQRAKTAGLALDTLDLSKLSDHADIWEKAIMKLRGNLMKSWLLLKWNGSLIRQ